MHPCGAGGEILFLLSHHDVPFGIGSAPTTGGDGQPLDRQLLQRRLLGDGSEAQAVGLREHGPMIIEVKALQAWAL